MAAARQRGADAEIPERAAEYYAELRGGPFAVDARIREALALTDAGRPEDALKALREGREELKLDAPALMSAESNCCWSSTASRKP